MRAGLSHLYCRLTANGIAAGGDLALLAALHPKSVRFASGKMLSPAELDGKSVYLIAHGWAARVKHLPNGDSQIVNFLMPGDFVCLETALGFESKGGMVEVLGDLGVLSFDGPAFRALAARQAGLTRALMWSLVRENTIISEHLVSVGRRSAYERVAHLLLELWWRMRQANIVHCDHFTLPLKLNHFGDALGLTPVHVSRTIQRLRQEGLFDIKFGRTCNVRVLQTSKAAVSSHFDEYYLRHGTMDVFGQGAHGPVAHDTRSM